MQAADAQVVCVFREDQFGVDGLKQIQQRTQAGFQLLSDFGTKATAAYSTGGLHTYVIDRQGVIQAVLEGQKTKRPLAEKVLAAISRLDDAKEPALAE